MPNWIKKILEFKIPEEWYHEDSFMYNLLHLVFWAIILGVFLFLMAKCS